MPFVVLKAGLSAILFARGFFPQEHYAHGVMVPAVLDPWTQNDEPSTTGGELSWEQKAREAVRTKGDHSYRFMLLKRNMSTAADRIIDFLDHGIRDALDKAYLRSLIVGVSVSPDDPMSIVEAYTFNFSYTMTRDGRFLPSIHMGHAPPATPSEEERTPVQVAEQLKNVMLGIANVADKQGSFQHVKGDRVFTFKVLYWEDRTPEDYSPPGFTPNDDNTLTFTFATGKDDEPRVDSYGQVSGQGHTVSVGCASIVHTFAPSKACATADPSPRRVVWDAEALIGPSLHDSSSLRTSSGASLSCDAQHTDGAHQVSQDTEMGPGREDMDQVACICGSIQDDGLMVLCDTCRTWSHMPCYGYKTKKTLPETFHCWPCALGTTIEPVQSKLQVLALQRRAVHLLGSKRLWPSAAEMGNLLGCTPPLVTAILDQLKRRNILSGVQNGGKTICLRSRLALRAKATLFTPDEHSRLIAHRGTGGDKQVGHAGVAETFVEDESTQPAMLRAKYDDASIEHKGQLRLAPAQQPIRTASLLGQREQARSKRTYGLRARTTRTAQLPPDMVASSAPRQGSANALHATASSETPTVRSDSSVESDGISSSTMSVESSDPVEPSTPVTSGRKRSLEKAPPHPEPQTTKRARRQAVAVAVAVASCSRAL